MSLASHVCTRKLLVTVKTKSRYRSEKEYMLTITVSIEFTCGAVSIKRGRRAEFPTEIHTFQSTFAVFIRYVGAEEPRHEKLFSLRRIAWSCRDHGLNLPRLPKGNLDSINYPIKLVLVDDFTQSFIFIKLLTATPVC